MEQSRLRAGGHTERLDPFPFQGDPYKQGSKDITPGQRSLSLDALPGAGYSTADKAPLKLKQQHNHFSPIILSAKGIVKRQVSLVPRGSSLISSRELIPVAAGSVGVEYFLFRYRMVAGKGRDKLPIWFSTSLIYYLMLQYVSPELQNEEQCSKRKSWGKKIGELVKPTVRIPRLVSTASRKAKKSARRLPSVIGSRHQFR
ncbi:hypothetical protein BHE74_00006229 [Ensete ventricosum]|nr:hypothetical protein BHE74_00006229 [Ensete ventricosum]